MRRCLGLLAPCRQKIPETQRQSWKLERVCGFGEPLQIHSELEVRCPAESGRVEVFAPLERLPSRPTLPEHPFRPTYFVTWSGEIAERVRYLLRPAPELRMCPRASV